MPISFRYKVRGTCATAICKMLLDANQCIVDASPKIIKRLGLESVQNIPADALILDNKYRTALECRGDPAALKKFQSILLPVLHSPFVLEPVLAPHAILKAEVSQVTSDGVYLNTGLECPVSMLEDPIPVEKGKQLLVTPVKPALHANKRYFFTTKLIITGKLVNLLVNETRPSFSYYLSEQRKKELAAIPFRLNDLSIPCTARFRSSAEHGTTVDLLGELQSLKNQLKQVLEASEKSPPGKVLYPGNPSVFILLTSLDKNCLDDIRNTVTPTIRGHHIWRGGSERLSNQVTLLEKILSRMPGSETEIIEAFRGFLLENIKRTIEIIHWKPTGNYYRLGSAQIVELDTEKLVLQREVFTKGIYDGLNVKKEPGDIILTTVPISGEWWLQHEYYSQKGNPKGIYFNINTPVELDYSNIRYFDLIVDVVKKPGSPSKIIDTEELDELVKREIISSKLQKKIMIIAEELKKNAEKHVFENLVAF